MVGIFLDVVAIWSRGSLLAQRNLSEDWFRFVMFALGLVVVSVIILVGSIPPLLMLPLYIAAVTAGMRFIVGASWVGAFIGAAIFVAYRATFEFLL